MSGKAKDPALRFWPRVDKTGDCWLWTGGLTHSGYGQFSVRYRKVVAHVWSYEASRGPVPSDRELDHLCRNRACVNPDHLEAVTHRENCIRGMAPNMVAFRANACRRGHVLTQENTFIQRGRASRSCKECRRAHTRASARRRRERGRTCASA